MDVRNPPPRSPARTRSPGSTSNHVGTQERRPRALPDTRDPLGRAVHADAVTATRLRHDAGVSAEPGQTTGAGWRRQVTGRPCRGGPARPQPRTSRPAAAAPPQAPRRGPRTHAPRAPSCIPRRPPLGPISLHICHPEQTAASPRRPRPPAARPRAHPACGPAAPGGCASSPLSSPAGSATGRGPRAQASSSPAGAERSERQWQAGRGAGAQRRAGRPAARPSRPCLLMPPARGTGSPGKLRPAAEARRR